MSEESQLEELRAQIQSITLDIVSLAGNRTNLARAVGKMKYRMDVPVVNHAVEENLRASVIRLCEKENHDSAFAMRILNLLIAEAKSVQDQTPQSLADTSAYTTWIRARELENSGRHVVHLEIGEPDFGPPPEVVEFMAHALLQGRTRYTATAGLLELRNSIAQYLNREHNTQISPEEVIVTAGGRSALFLSVMTIVRPGDEVIIFDPSYPAYDDLVTAAGALPVHVPARLEDDWIPDLSRLDEEIRSNTRMIILNSPANPTGKVVKEPWLSELVDIAVANELAVLSDEVYGDFCQKSPPSILEFVEGQSVYLNSFSKSYGMTGFRLGFAVSDIQSIERMSKLQNLCLTSVSEFIQCAGLAALTCQREQREYARTVRKRIEVSSALMRNLPFSFVVPEGGLYLFPRLSSNGIDGTEFSARLLSEAGISITPGSVFGKDYAEFFRMSVCQPESVLVTAIEAMKELLA